MVTTRTRLAVGAVLVGGAAGFVVLLSLFVGFADQAYRMGNLVVQTVKVGAHLLLVGVSIGVYRATSPW